MKGTRSNATTAESSGPKPLSGVLGYVKGIGTLDLRSLALFRISLALIILCDLLVRAGDMAMFYTDRGVLPRVAVIEKFTYPTLVSLHFMGGTLFSQVLLFLCAAAAAIALLIGFRTRIVSLVSWVLLISLHTRNPVILQGGDVLLRILLFWSIFLPLGEAFSVDAALNSEKKARRAQVSSAATFALLLQVALVYIFVALAKTGPEWRHDGTALYFALSVDQMRTLLGSLLLHAPLGLLKFITFFLLLVEGAGAPALIFSKGRLRTFVVALFVLLPLGLGSVLKTGIFPFVCAAAVVPFLPREFWDQVPLVFHRRDRAPFTVYYDGDCSFCKRSVYLLRTFLLLQDTKLLPAQDSPARHQEMKRYNSWIVVDRAGQAMHTWGALVTLMQHSPLFFLLGKLLDRPWLLALGERLYRKVERSRTFLSRATNWLQFRPLPARLGILGQILVSLLLGCILWWNLSNEFPGIVMPQRKQALGFLARLDQVGDMLAPVPLKEDGWYVIEGKLKEGSTVDLWRHTLGPPSFEKPVNVAAMYPNERWRRYFMSLYLPESAQFRPYFGEYLCRQWNSAGELAVGKELTSLKIYFMMKTNQPPGLPPVIARQVLWSQPCL
ncbi:MAG TPA: HTTM domain-containing protein [Alphaproteobacteria bacterium]|nr:HTTM domain-containing protein [Alphaproteobacteria bacterium]